MKSVFYSVFYIDSNQHWHDICHADEKNNLKSQHDTRSIVWVATEKIHLVQKHLPKNKLSYQQQLKLIPHLVEEELLEPLTELHFASCIEGDNINIAVVNHACMQNWLATIAEKSKLTPAIILPDLMALPYIPDSWTIWVEDKRFLVRTSKLQGFACDKKWFESILPFISATTSQQKIVIFTTDKESVPASLHAYIQAPPADLCSLMEHEAHTLATKSNKNLLNLLQGDYAVKKSSNSFVKKNKVLLVWCSAVFIMYIILSWLGILSLNQNITILKRQTTSLYQEMFGVKKVPTSIQYSAPKQIKLLQQAVAKRDNYWQLLKKIAPIMGSCNKCSIQHIKFNATSLELLINSATEQKILAEKLNNIQDTKLLWDVIEQQDGKNIRIVLRKND